MTQNSENNPGVRRPRRHLVVALVLALNAFVIGGCVALLVVNRLLLQQLDVYSSHDLFESGSVILDFMDDMLPLYLVYGGAFFLLLGATLTVWIWNITQSRVLRYGIIVLWLVLVLGVAGLGWPGSMEAPTIPPMTPTPVG